MLSLGARGRNGTEIVGAAPQGAGVVEEGFPHGALQPVGGGPVLVAVAEPLTVLLILQVFKGPIVNTLVPFGIFCACGYDIVNSVR